GPAGDGGVDDLEPGMLASVELEELEEPGRLASGRPPGEDLELAGALGPCVSGTEAQHHHERPPCATRPHRRPPVRPFAFRCVSPWTGRGGAVKAGPRSAVAKRSAAPGVPPSKPVTTAKRSAVTVCGEAHALTPGGPV